MRIRTEAERKVFEKYFIGKESKKKWLLIFSDEFLRLLQPVHLPLDNQITIANFTIDGEGASLWESYQVSSYNAKRLLKVGHWRRARRCPDAHLDCLSFSNEVDEGLPSSDGSTPTSPRAAALLSIPKEVKTALLTMDSGVLLAPADDPVQRRKDLTGLHLTCTTIDYLPVIALEEGPVGSVRVGGLLGKFFLTLKEITNFTYTCRRVKDGEWGAAVDGHWTGMIGEVSDGTAEIAVAPLTVTQKRSAVTRFIPSADVVTKWLCFRPRHTALSLETSPIELKTVVTPFIQLGFSVLVALGILAAECFSRRSGIVSQGNPT
ncbi:putative glutamate receptor 2-like [Penaeus vannamei]|uniref:Putative glutamate receptor 2-like n=1 Tax=Penaeus vannamei TaxID=6689 RepID=A0A3R7MK89_PENVA|nr:putative glutamate receptor 2-like [Penaeus vannamei]